MLSKLLVPFALALGGVCAAPTVNYINWKTFKGNGINLGGWLAQEAVIDPTWYVTFCLPQRLLWRGQTGSC